MQCPINSSCTKHDPSKQCDIELQGKSAECIGKEKKPIEIVEKIILDTKLNTNKSL